VLTTMLPLMKDGRREPFGNQNTPMRFPLSPACFCFDRSCPAVTAREGPCWRHRRLYFLGVMPFSASHWSAHRKPTVWVSINRIGPLLNGRRVRFRSSDGGKLSRVAGGAWTPLRIRAEVLTNLVALPGRQLISAPPRPKMSVVRPRPARLRQPLRQHA
jgi:hypothetical protein